MRHKVAGRKFDRNTGSRKALLRNLVSQLFQHDRIVTTKAKAKEVRSIAEKLITKAKREDLHSRRQVLKVLTNKTAVKRLFDVIVAKISDRNSGGYTRIIKLGNRKGDDAPMALLEIIEPGAKHSKAQKTTKKKASTKGKPKDQKLPPASKTKPKKEQETEKAPISSQVEGDKGSEINVVDESTSLPKDTKAEKIEKEETP